MSAARTITIDERELRATLLAELAPKRAAAVLEQLRQRAEQPAPGGRLSREEIRARVLKTIHRRGLP